MSWSIANIDNTVIVSVELARAIATQFPNLPILEDAYDEPENPFGLLDGDTLYFTEDHQEHMDWVTHDEALLQFLAQNGVQGDITFGSLEGDNAGHFWGVRFDGQGAYRRLTGHLAWTEEPLPSN